MALSVTYSQPSDWFYGSGTARNITGVAWSSGDIIVVIGVTEDNSRTLTAPTNANLTFTQRVTPGNTGNECKTYCWSATAGSSQTGQTIAATISASGSHGGIAVWVVTGSPSGVTGGVTNYTESALSIAVGAGDIVCYAFADWNATTPGKTPATGSGTATERVDTGNGSTYGVYMADWVGTSSGTFSFGPNNYTGLKSSQIALVVQAPTSSDTNAAAEVATTTATANSGTVNVDTDAGSASAIATAYDATVSTSVDATAGLASATAAAQDATTTVSVDAGSASATTTALDATTTVDPAAGAASATATAYDATVTTDSKWENYTHDFPGASLDSTFWTGTYGDAVTVSGNKATFPSATVTYSGISTSTTGHDLIGSYVLVQLDPRSTGGYSGITVKDDGTNVDILSISYRHTAGQLEGAYNGSDWSDTDSSATVAFTDAGVWFRLREASGTGYMEYSSNGSSWTVLHSDTMSASALTALAGCKVELNCGPFSSSMTTGPSFANFNLPPTGTNADAGAASATASAQTPTANVDTDTEVASATATAYDATVSIDTDAEVATATATAHDATAGADVNADAELASAVATAHDATVTIDTDAEVATATATAHDGTAGADVNADAELASATTAAQDATTTVDSDVEAASAVATAHDATVTTSVGADAEAASATAAAYDATSTVDTDSGVASATATAYNATVSISGTQFRLTIRAPIRALEALAPRAGAEALAPIRALYAKEPTRDPA
jgi:hypothetical protein